MIHETTVDDDTGASIQEGGKERRILISIS